MPKTKRSPSRKTNRKQKKLPALPPIMSDEESVEYRRRKAEEENAPITPIRLLDDFHGEYEVGSTQWKDPYLVEIRDLSGRANSCSCIDFQMNRLGTCKHIIRTLEVIAHRRKGRMMDMAAIGSPVEEIFVDTTADTPRLRWTRSDQTGPKIVQMLSPFFDSEGLSLGPLPEATKAVSDLVDSLSARLQKQVRISQLFTPWILREKRFETLGHLRMQFEADVASGKRSNNPVQLPLYPYQQEGMRHLAFTGRALLADEMGLGKTVQAIAASELLRSMGKIQRILVVSPASLKGEWADQLLKFTGKPADLLFGPRHVRLEEYNQHHDILLCNYEQVRMDADEINARFAPDLIILDEAQRIKNWPTKTAKTIKRLQSPFAFVLTGTPLENRVQEVYSLCEFIDPHLFGTLDRFHREFMRVGPDGKGLEPRDLPGLHRRVSKVMLRRRKSDIDEDLPDREDKIYKVGMTEEQQIRYDDFNYQLSLLMKRLEGRRPTKEELDRIQLLLGCMRMTCDTPYILDQDCRDCPKLEELSAILEEVLEEPETKILIFSEWVRMLDLVKKRLEGLSIDYAEHTGKIPQKKRRDELNTFKEDPDCRVLLSSESGGVGLNLQNANVVINLDLPWNPAKLEQRIARAWRKHQKRSVRVVNLVTANSIEETMIGKLEEKSALADAVLDGKTAKPDSEEKQENFLSRVRAVVGEPNLDEPSSRRLSKKKQTDEKESQPASLKDIVIARYGERIRGVQEAPNGTQVVVAQPGSGLRDIQQTARHSVKTPSVVISTETLAAIKELQKMGILQVAVPLEIHHHREGAELLQASEKVAPPPKRYPKEAYAHWQTVANERKAAKTLMDLGMADQARPHLDHALTQAMESLSILFTGTPDGYQKGEKIPTDETRTFAELEHLQERTPIDIRASLRFCASLDRILHETP